jgi:hypothetical protein
MGPSASANLFRAEGAVNRISDSARIRHDFNGVSATAPPKSAVVSLAIRHTSVGMYPGQHAHTFLASSRRAGKLMPKVHFHTSPCLT